MMEKLYVLCGLLTLVSVVLCEQYEIVWSKESVQMCSHKILVRSGDSLKFTCPVGSYSTIWYLVAQEQYDNCDCGSKTCLRPAFCPGVIPYSYTVDIVRNSEQLGNAQDFQPGRTYYFASFSTGTLDSRDHDSGGECVTDGLKLEIEVLPVDSYTCECEEQGSGKAFSSAFSSLQSVSLTPSPSLSPNIMLDNPSKDSVRACERSDSLSVGGAIGIGVAVGAAGMVLLVSIIMAVALALKKCHKAPSGMNTIGQHSATFEKIDPPEEDACHIYDSPPKILGK